MMHRSLTLAAFAAVVATAVLTRAQGPAGTSAGSMPCAVQVSEFLLPPQVERVSDLEVDADGNLVVAGRTSAADFPTTPDAVKRVCGTEGDGFVMVVTPGGTVRYSTCLGGNLIDSSTAAVPAAGGAIWAISRSCYRVNPGDEYSLCDEVRETLWWLRPGSPAGSWQSGVSWASDTTWVNDVTAARDGSLWILATTEAAGIRTVNAWQPTLAGESDMLLAHYAPGRPDPVLLTYLGGTGADSGTALALAPDGDPIVEGWFSPGFPLIRPAHGQWDGVGGSGLARVDMSGRWLEYATFIESGGAARRLAVDAHGYIVFVGTPHRSDSPPPDVVHARQHEIGLTVLDESGKVRSSALLDDGLDEFSPIDLGTRVAHIALLGRGLVLVVGSYWAEDIISGAFFLTVADASGSWAREPLVVRRPSWRACSLEAAASRGRDVYVAAYEWPTSDAQRKIITLRLRPGIGDNAGAGAGRDRY